MMKEKTLKTKFCWYFILFSILILAFLWTFQILFLNKYYEYEKTNDIQEVAKKIAQTNTIDDLQQIISDASYDKNICIEITNNKKSIYSSEYLSTGCLNGQESTTSYKEDFISSNSSSRTYKIINPKFHNKTLVYAIKLNTGLYAFVNTSIQPIDSTIIILKNQLIYVTIIVLGLSIIIAYFISKKISKPIDAISQSAKKLANNDFHIDFDHHSDIKELNHLADTLNYAKNELQKTDELRRDLMANISHDLKTPLTMIKAYAEMERDLNQSKEKQIESMNTIIEETDRLTILVNDILSLSKMQSEIEKLEYSSFDLVELIHTILKRYAIFKDTENYHFIFNCHKKINITADKKKLEQVIYNLVNNAINYTGDDKKVILHIIENKKSIRVEIKDTGSGIHQEDIPYIWDKYYKNQKKYRRNIIGTGLGLSIVKTILELHHYEYGVESTPKGTTFYFVIKKH